MRPTLCGIQSIQRRRQRQGICIPNTTVQVTGSRPELKIALSTPSESSEASKMTKIYLKNAVVKTYLQNFQSEKSLESNKEILACIIDQVSSEVSHPGKSILWVPQHTSFLSMRLISIQMMPILRLPIGICQSFPHLEAFDVSTVLGRIRFDINDRNQNGQLRSQDIISMAPVIPHASSSVKNYAWVNPASFTDFEHVSHTLLSLTEPGEESKTTDLKAPDEFSCSAAINQAFAFSKGFESEDFLLKSSSNFDHLRTTTSDQASFLPELWQISIKKCESSRRGARRGSVFHKSGSLSTAFV